MSREFYLKLAEEGFAMPLAVDLYVHELSSPEAIDQDPAEMARVMIAAAKDLNTPLAIAPMDLRVEKDALGRMLGVAESELEKFHLTEPLPADQFKTLCEDLDRGQMSRRMQVLCDALAIVSRESDLRPVGMSIGPLSLLTKIIADPITSIYMIGQGLGPEDDEDVELALQVLDIGRRLVKTYVRAQVRAGACEMIICEPAANTAYISPKMMDEEGSDVFEKCVMEGALEIAGTIRDAGGELIFHDCGELTPSMIRNFNRLRPVMISFGSPVKLSDAAALVEKDIVLYGNIPSKHFPSESVMPLEKVRMLSDELLGEMAATGHPFILGSECDILCVECSRQSIFTKTKAIAGKSRLATTDFSIWREKNGVRKSAGPFSRPQNSET